MIDLTEFIDSWFFRKFFKTKMVFIERFVKLLDGCYINTDFHKFTILSEWKKSKCRYKFYFRFQNLLYPKIKIAQLNFEEDKEFVLFHKRVNKSNLNESLKEIKKKLRKLYSFKSSKKLEEYMFNNKEEL
jgi:spore cortex formation protein SpoVR/YcgB (stage V sporulation)